MTFGSLIPELHGFIEVLSTYAAASAAKMRREGLTCTSVKVFLETNRFIKNESQYHPCVHLSLPHATDYTAEINVLCQEYRYNKSAVILQRAISAGERQTSLFDLYDWDRMARINTTLDVVHARFGGR